ncbi:MAG: methyltransferase [Myxococcales bacterium]|nr:methyltransferase [Myxococcales bacterium]
MAHEGLNVDDPGIRLLADAVAEVPPSALALVCSGPLPGVGPGATRLVSDVRERPEAGERCVPFSFAVDEGRGASFDAAVVWPRAHLGKDFSLACLARGALLLRPGGRLLCAARKNKGGGSLAAVIGELVGEVEVVARDRGYNLYVGVHRGEIDREAAAAHLGVRYAIDDPLLGPPPLLATPGVFCRKHLDQGTRALIERAAELAARGELGEPRRILDLCAGIGPLALWAAARWPAAAITAVESNLLACACLRENAAARGLGGRIEVLAQDGLGDISAPAELALINPPTHAGEEELRALLAPLPRLLAGGVALFVVNRHGRLVGLLDEIGAATSIHAVPGFSLVSARW